jgi:hypothetical protein
VIRVEKFFNDRKDVFRLNMNLTCFHCISIFCFMLLNKNAMR